MVRIIGDTTAGLPREVFAARDITLIPQIVMFGETSYRDDTELDTATFLQKLRASAELPRTAAPPPALYAPAFEAARAAGEAVVVVAPSGRVSGTVRSALTAAQDFPGLDVRVVDTQTIAGNLATLLLLAREWADQGLDADAIVNRLNALIPRGRIYFLVDTLEYLAKGGRIGGAKALMGELLQVKPILTLREGQVEPYEQQRTKKRALARLAEIVLEQCPPVPESHLVIMHVEAPDEAFTLASDLQTRFGLPSMPAIYELPPAIVVHAGPKAMGVGFFTK